MDLRLSSNDDRPLPDSRDAPARVAILMRASGRPVLLARALASVLAQSTSDWHLFLIDTAGDATGASAGLADLVTRHRSGFGDRITVLSQAPSPDAIAPFAYLAQLDDGDSWHPEFLAHTIRWLAHPEGAVFAGVSTHWWAVQERLDAAGLVDLKREAVPFESPVLAYDSVLCGAPLPLNALLSRAATVRGAGLLDGANGASDERAAILRLLEQGDIGVLPKRLAYRHRREDETESRLGTAPGDLLRDPVAEQVRARNAELRASARTDPGALAIVGVLGEQNQRLHEHTERQRQLILANLDRNGLWGHARHEDLQHRLIRVEQTLERLEQALSTLALRRKPLWKRLARRLAGPLIDRARRRSA